MGEKSYFWQGVSTGDASLAPYSGPAHGRVLFAPFNAQRLLSLYDPYIMNVIKGYLNELAVTKTGDTTVQVDTGAAIVDGIYYRNTTALSVSVPGGDGYYYIALRKDVSAQTVVVALIGPSGSAPTLSKVSSGVFEEPLALVNKAAGVISTVADARKFIKPENFALRARNTMLGSYTIGYDSSLPYGYPTPPMLPLRYFCGVSTWTGAAAGSGSFTITLPTSLVLLGSPAVVATANNTDGRINVATTSTPTTITFYWFAHPPTTYTAVNIMWMAFAKYTTGGS